MFDSLNTENVLSPEYSMWHPHSTYGEWRKSVQPPKPLRRCSEARGSGPLLLSAQLCIQETTISQAQDVLWRIFLCQVPQPFAQFMKPDRRNWRTFSERPLPQEKTSLCSSFSPATFLTPQPPAWPWPWPWEGRRGHWFWIHKEIIPEKVPLLSPK